MGVPLGAGLMVASALGPMLALPQARLVEVGSPPLGAARLPPRGRRQRPGKARSAVALVRVRASINTRRFSERRKQAPNGRQRLQQ